MRPLVIFMIVVGVFVLGRSACHFGSNNWHFGSFNGVDGKGEIVTTHRNATGFTRISNAISANIEWREGESGDIEILAQQNVTDLLKTEVKNNALEIYFDESVGNCKPITIRITSPKLEGVEIAGSGDFYAYSPVRADKVTFEIAGSGSISTPGIVAGTVKCSIAGSGDISMGGSAENLDVEIAGSGSTKSKDLQANNVDVEIAGSGDVFCTAKTKLKVSIAGSGSVHYAGDAAIESHTDGSGDVIKD